MTITKRYRATPTGDRYTITFQKKANGTIDLHCSEHPPDPYGKSVASTHLYESGRICVAEGKEPKTMERAQAIAAAWMTGFSTYVRRGAFPKETRRFNV